MGVYRLFYHFINKYPNIVNTITKQQNCKALNLDIDILAIDLNAIFHPCCQLVYGYGQKPKNKLVRKENIKPKEPLHVLQKRAFNAITKKIEDLVYYNQPKSILYLAVDGVAGMSKQTQQRQRRFRYAKEIKEDTFDSNCITTGSMFMEELSRYISNFIQIKLKSEWKHLKIVFNNGRVVGEGEHKLIHYIKKLDSKLSASIVSPDADLIMLALGLNRTNIYIFRDNIFDNFYGDYFFVYIDILRDKILSNVNPKVYTLHDKNETSNLKVVSNIEYYKNLQNKFGKRDELQHRILEDFIFYLFMLGNDFLPHIPSLEIPNNGIETLLLCYDRVISNHGFISSHFYNREKKAYDIKINYKSFKELLKELSNLECTMLVQKVTKNMTHNDTVLENNIIRSENGIQINFEKYREEYYMKKLKLGMEFDFISGETTFNNTLFEQQVKNIVYEYTRGMVFVLKYYLYNIPTFDWYYPFHYAPLLTDIYNYLPEDIDYIDFEFANALSPLEQLLCVLPKESFRLLPKELHGLVLNENTPLQHMYPKHHIIDLEGKKNDYEGICILPFTDANLIRKEFAKVRLNEFDQKRNQTGFVYDYTFDYKSNSVEIKYFK